MRVFCFCDSDFAAFMVLVSGDTISATRFLQITTSIILRMTV